MSKQTRQTYRELGQYQLKQTLMCLNNVTQGYMLSSDEINQLNQVHDQLSQILHQMEQKTVQFCPGENVYCDHCMIQSMDNNLEIVYPCGCHVCVKCREDPNVGSNCIRLETEPEEQMVDE